jgi:glutaredoxin 3
MVDVVIYTRLFCGYCARATALLDRKGVPYQEIDAGNDPATRKEMIQRSNGASTYPQVFVGGRHIGGSDQLFMLDRSGELDRLLKGAA